MCDLELNLAKPEIELHGGTWLRQGQGKKSGMLASDGGERIKMSGVFRVKMGPPGMLEVDEPGHGTSRDQQIIGGEIAIAPPGRGWSNGDMWVKRRQDMLCEQLGVRLLPARESDQLGGPAIPFCAAGTLS